MGVGCLWVDERNLSRELRGCLCRRPGDDPPHLYRQAIWTKIWSSSATHKVKIVVVGTSGRPTVTTDGLVYVK
ncbi:hypothetical protein ACFWVU_25810 [Streptomyces sp. NPDC058686]|uniref:hypothetical protein n=1 Tax=Streptomyces sp. NPDC058686 TaxID=3346599 RepID=UPI00365864B7